MPVPAREELTLIYDQYRTSLFNVKYFGHVLSQAQKINLLSEILVAIGATTGGAIAGWSIWKQELAAPVWAVIAGAAAVIATIKPIIRLPEKVERFSKLY